jgi:hypothetical protein
VVPDATPGVSTLLLGKTDAPKPVETKNPFVEGSTQKPPLNWSLIKKVFLVSDILLILPTSFFVLTKGSRMTFLEGTVCVVVFGFAAALGCLAYLIHQHGRK